jgi:hypothetical protein
MASRQQEIAMDLAQKANRVKRELQAAAHKPEEISIRHAVEAFDAFVDGVVEEIGQLKSALKNGSASADDAVKGLGEAVVSRSDAPDVEPVEGRGAGKSLEREPG